jgi:hypothetical protein
VPDQVAVQQPAPLGVLLGVQEGGEKGFEPDHFLIALGQRADGDERLAQVSEGRGGGQLVERLVGELDAARGEAGQHGRDGRLGQPAHRRARVPGSGDLAAECLQPGRKGPAGGTHELVEAPVDEAAGAPAGAGMGRVTAGRAGGPGRGRGAADAERIGQGARDDRGVTAAGRAGSGPVLVGRAPGLAGEAGDAARRGLGADRAGQEPQPRTARAQRPVRGAPLDPAAPRGRVLRACRIFALGCDPRWASAANTDEPVLVRRRMTA